MRWGYQVGVPGGAGVGWITRGFKARGVKFTSTLPNKNAD